MIWICKVPSGSTDTLRQCDFPCSSGLNLDAITLKMDAARVDLDAKSHITANHKAADNVARAQYKVYKAADRIKELKQKLKSSTLTGTCDPAFDSARQ
jgi:hypothetical protein